jgi:signal transduction histidine kinase
LGFDLELAVFRIVQESLSNVHRHSHSSTANILLVCEGSSLNLEIADQGQGNSTGQGQSGSWYWQHTRKGTAVEGNCEYHHEFLGHRY